MVNSELCVEGRYLQCLRFSKIVGLPVRKGSLFCTRARLWKGSKRRCLNRSFKVPKHVQDDAEKGLLGRSLDNAVCKKKKASRSKGKPFFSCERLLNSPFGGSKKRLRQWRPGRARSAEAGWAKLGLGKPPFHQRSRVP